MDEKILAVLRGVDDSEVKGAAAPYHPAMYVGLGLLHGSVALRVIADLAESPLCRMASGPLTVIGLVAFLAVLFRQIRVAARRRLS